VIRVSRGVINSSWSTLTGTQHILVVLDAPKLLYKEGKMPIEAYMFRRLAEYEVPVTIAFNKIDQILENPEIDGSIFDGSTTAQSFRNSTDIRVRASPRLLTSDVSLASIMDYLIHCAIPSHFEASSAHFISAQYGWGLETLKKVLEGCAVSGPHLYSKDVVTDTAPQAFLHQFVRQGFYECLYGYLPYTLRQRTSVWQEIPTLNHSSQAHEGNGTALLPPAQILNTNPSQSIAGVKIVQEVFVDRPGQEKIVVGKGGQIVAQVQKKAAQELSEVLGYPVELFIEVKVSRA
jgi:GTP-binding protein Era